VPLEYGTSPTSFDRLTEPGNEAMSSPGSHSQSASDSLGITSSCSLLAYLLSVSLV